MIRDKNDRIFIRERYNLTHNDWSRIFRTIFAAFFGKETNNWPSYMESIIYFLSNNMEIYWTSVDTRTRKHK